ncbi:MAG: cupin domain-containing protein [Acidobacteriota bacterium]
MTQESRSAGVVVKAAAKVPFQEVAAGRKAAMQVLLGPADGATHFALRRFRMEAGGGMPLHTNRVEHEQYVLAGRGRVRIGEEIYDVEPGDVLLIPAGAPHSYEVLEGPFEFLCIVPNEPDQVEVLNTGH